MVAGLGIREGEGTYQLDFDGTWTLFILTPAAWSIGRALVGAFLREVTYLEGSRRAPMEGDILAYLNQKEFPTRTYLRSNFFALLAF